jgi:putative transposase
VSLLHAHLVFVTKFRRTLFTGDMLTFCEHTMRAGCTELDVELIEYTAKPTTCTCSSPTRQPWLFQLRCSGSKAVSCGGAPLSIIKQYIDGQARPL